jgi:hypothetical protein
MDEEPNLNSGTPWSPREDDNIRWGIDHGRSIEETADFLCRTPSGVRQRMNEIAEADEVGDPPCCAIGCPTATASAWKPVGTLAPRWLDPRGNRRLRAAGVGNARGLSVARVHG